jgi:hypothetical protein
MSTLPVVLALAIAAAVCAGCGGSTGSTSSSAEAGGGSTARGGGVPAAESGNSRGSGGGSKSGGGGPPPGGGGAATGEGGPPASEAEAESRAQAFVKPHGDNSIPKFGEAAGRGEFVQAERTIGEYLDARAAGDWTKACTFLAPEALQELKLIEKASGGKVHGCAETLEGMLGSSPRSSRASVLVFGLAAVRVKRGSNTAFAMLHGPHGADYVIPVLREPSSWKIVQISPVPYPLGTPVPSP